MHLSCFELRDSDEARRFLQQSLWLSRSVAPAAELVEPTLACCQEMLAAGAALPPAGLVCDVAHIALASGDARRPLPALPASAAALLRQYEDLVLGKLYADGSFQRAADALAHYQAADRRRGLAFLIQRFAQRAGFGGAVVSPGVVRGLMQRAAPQVLADGWQQIARDGFDPLVIESLQQVVTAVRSLGDALGAEDVFELEHGTALAGFSQRVALRQVLQAAAELERRLPQRRPRATKQRRAGSVASRVLDEDTYPVGGFASITMHGTIESLLHSQLAYMERAERPDLFDAKLLRGELLYYSRDENQFFRRRRTFVFALPTDLSAARVKDARLPWQRIVLLLGWLVTAVRRLSDWLGDEALQFEFLLVPTSPPGRRQAAMLPVSLDAERELLETLLSEPIAHGQAEVREMAAGQLEEHCRQLARRSDCRLLVATASQSPPAVSYPEAARLSLAGPEPLLQLGDEPQAERTTGAGPLDAWSDPLLRLLTWWL